MDNNQTQQPKPNEKNLEKPIVTTSVHEIKEITFEELVNNAKKNNK